VPLLGWALGVAVLLAMVIAQIWWIKHAGWHNAKNWGDAIKTWPQMFDKAQVDLFIGVICAALGAHSAYWRAGKRFRRVIVMEE
jgi:hypothetical protein